LQAFRRAENFIVYEYRIVLIYGRGECLLVPSLIPWDSFPAGLDEAFSRAKKWPARQAARLKRPEKFANTPPDAAL
jgi:hypothetical protein